MEVSHLRFLAKISWILMATFSVNMLVCAAINDFPQIGPLNVEFFCQNSTASFGCSEENSLIEVQTASFGKAITDICVSRRIFNKDHRQCDLIDNKALMKSLCDFKNKCEVFISEEMFGNNMCPDVKKYLNLMYVCVRNPKRTKPTMETTTVKDTASRANHSMSESAGNKTEAAMTSTTNGNGTETANTSTRPATNSPITARKRTKTKKEEQAIPPITFNPDGAQINFLSNQSPNQPEKVWRTVYLLVLLSLLAVHW